MPGSTLKTVRQLPGCVEVDGTRNLDVRARLLRIIRLQLLNVCLVTMGDLLELGVAVLSHGSHQLGVTSTNAQTIQSG